HLDLNFPSLIERRWENFLHRALLVSNQLPSEPAIVGFKAFAVGDVPDGGVLRVQGMDAAEIVSDWRNNLLPVAAAVGSQKKSPGLAGDPADLIRRRGTREEIGGHAALLRFPAFARVGRTLDSPSGADAPGLLFVRRNDQAAPHRLQHGKVTPVHGRLFCADLYTLRYRISSVSLTLLLLRLLYVFLILGEGPVRNLIGGLIGSRTRGLIRVLRHVLILHLILHLIRHQRSPGAAGCGLMDGRSGSHYPFAGDKPRSSPGTCTQGLGGLFHSELPEVVLLCRSGFLRSRRRHRKARHGRRMSGQRGARKSGRSLAIRANSRLQTVSAFVARCSF